jgi:hypothetical protein
MTRTAPPTLTLPRKGGGDADFCGRCTSESSVFIALALGRGRVGVGVGEVRRAMSDRAPRTEPPTLTLPRKGEGIRSAMAESWDAPAREGAQTE